MGKVKIEDVHKLLDLVHEVGMKTNHKASIDYSENKLVCIYASKEDGTEEITEVFGVYPNDAEWYGEKYKKCKEFLEYLLSEVKENE